MLLGRHTVGPRIVGQRNDDVCEREGVDGSGSANR